MTTIACFSDTHGYHHDQKLNEWFEDNPADILVFAGDYQYNNDDDGVNFMDWVMGLPYTHKVIIPGNHDGNALGLSVWLDYMSGDFENLHFVIHDKINVLGLKFFCSAYSAKFGNWWFSENEDKLNQLYQQIPNDTDILITHGGAFRTLDRLETGENVGSTALKDRINNLPNLKAHIFGHIHESYGTYVYNGYDAINCSFCNYRYNPVNMPILFEV